MNRKEIIDQIKSTTKWKTHNGLITMIFIVPSRIISGHSITEDGDFWEIWEYLVESEIREVMVDEGYYIEYQKLYRPEYNWYEPERQDYDLDLVSVETYDYCYVPPQIKVKVMFRYEQKEWCYESYT